LNESCFLEGRILKGIGGFYYIQDTNGSVHECKAPGRFRNDNIVPLTGDNVLFSSGGFIEEIKPRKNELTRPRVVNVDMAAIVISTTKPKIDQLLCDKLIVSIKSKNIAPLLIINKCDVGDKTYIDALQSEYKNVCETICVSAKSGEGLEALKMLLEGKCTCLAGQSAAGKSSILNALFPGFNLVTGGLSKKTERGTHTTRQTELLVAEGFTGAVVDTPGFSFFDSADMEPEDLSRYYDDMSAYNENCRFTSCLHSVEPDCGVKDAVSKGLISKGRYKRYLLILKEIQDKR
jgi:ribosome biogenesis GTPase